jgi:hypothetical protein
MVKINVCTKHWKGSGLTLQEISMLDNPIIFFLQFLTDVLMAGKRLQVVHYLEKLRSQDKVTICADSPSDL